jgi:RHS repeat-associated protein
MGNSAHAPSEVISLPSGGGALQGLGEKFSPDLHTGTGNFSLPILVPPGRNGLQPKLDLAYSTGNGNGFFGLGWGIGVPGVSRNVSRGVPRYDARDTFILSGVDDLVAVERVSEATTRFRPRTEGLFARILHHRDPRQGIDYWEVLGKDGVVSVYGKPGSATDPASAVVADPADPVNVFAWRLTETRDPFGNFIRYRYELDEGDDGTHMWRQPCLSEVAYVDYDDNGTTKCLATVRFQYEARADAFSDYRAGFEIRTSLRCRSIATGVHPGTDIDVRRYELEYAEDPYDGISLLAAVRVVGFDDAGQDQRELPAVEFGYTRFQPIGRSFEPVEGSELPAISLARPDVELVDVTGDGLPDVIELNGRALLRRNVGGGKFDRPETLPNAPAGLSLSAPGVQLLDADGDARADVLVSTQRIAGFFPLGFDARFEDFRPYKRAPTFNLEDAETRLVDLTGDGITDAIRSNGRLECYFNDPVDGWDGPHLVEPGPFAGLRLADPRVKWADMNGDGLQDVVLLEGHSLWYAPSLGHGRFGRPVRMRNLSDLPYDYDPARMLLGDVDGDGLADLVYPGTDEVLVWINRSGNAFGDRLSFPGTPPATDVDRLRIVDLLGTGTAGVLWSGEPRAPGQPSMYFLDPSGRTKPRLLNRIDNNIGATTTVEYASSAELAAADRRRRCTRWRTPLPSPVHVVARVTSIDAISRGKLTTEYRYRNGYRDGTEAEFRGFGYVEQVDTQIFDGYSADGADGADPSFASVPAKHFSAPTLLKSWFHLGPVDEDGGSWRELDWSEEYWQGDPNLLRHTEQVNRFLTRLRGGSGRSDRRARRDALRALRGKVLRTELYALDGSERQTRPYTVVEYAYDLREEEASATEARPRVFFPFASAERTTQWERGDDPLTHFVFSGDHDAYGQARQQTSVAPPRRSARRRPLTAAIVGTIDPDEVRMLATHTRTEYAQGRDDIYIRDRVSQRRLFELLNPPTPVERTPANVRAVLEDQAAAARQVLGVFERLNGADVRLIAHTVHHYDGAAFVGLGVGALGRYGALTRSEALVMTDDVLDAAYGPLRPAYLGGSAGTAVSGTPPGFGQDLGYRLRTAGPTYAAGYYADVNRRRYDFQASGPPPFGLAAWPSKGVLIANQDARRSETTIEPDRYWLFTSKVTDAIGLETTVTHDYRASKPSSITEVNGNSAHMRYTPLGLAAASWSVSRSGSQGGSAAKPDVRFTYDFDAYVRTRADRQPQPISVRSSRRVFHAKAGDGDEAIESLEYSDGFGRLLEQRVQAEDLTFGKHGDEVGLPPGGAGAPSAALGQRSATRVVVSGSQSYDNKGREVIRREPRFSDGWRFEGPDGDSASRQVERYYDPRGNIIRAVNPDGSQQRVVYGTPSSPAALDVPAGDEDPVPAGFDPSPWATYAYDENDLAPVSPPALAGRAPPRHWFTPITTVNDALGRHLCVVERAGPDPAKDWYATRSTYDSSSNVLTLTDALGRRALRHVYDRANRPLRVESIDAGTRTSVLDALGKLVEYRAENGSVALRDYDVLGRPVHVWAANGDDGVAPTLTLRERIEYGDGGETPATAAERAARQAMRAVNALSKPVLHWDEAGVTRFQRYDFKGNLLRKVRQVVSDAALSQVASGTPWVADWSQPGADNDLDPFTYQTDVTLDALNRPIEVIQPRDVEGKRRVVRPHYNRAGALEAVTLFDSAAATAGQAYVEQIAYDAKGQRVLIVYGNGTMTRYAHDDTFRLARMRTERLAAAANPDEWRGSGQPLQDSAYGYDLVGNVTAIEERVPNCGIAGSANGRNRLARDFTYDPLYRLLSATGRACAGDSESRRRRDLVNCGSIPGGSVVASQQNAPDLTEPYAETYDYDPVGNLLELRYARLGQPGVAWRRVFGMGGRPAAQWRTAPSNRATSVRTGQTRSTWSFDENGNASRQNQNRHYTWDHADRLVGYRVQSGGSPTLEARYLYGADGIRVKKWVTRGAASESTVYIDGVFEHHRSAKVVPGGRNNTLHILDGQARIALVGIGPRRQDDFAPRITYELSDYQRNSAVVLADDGRLVGREEFFPYGETSFGSFSRKRYRFAGKERDEESALSYHERRYYAPWTGRWMSCDPEPKDHNLFRYASSNPIRFADVTGRDGEEAFLAWLAARGVVVSGGAGGGVTVGGGAGAAGTGGLLVAGGTLVLTAAAVIGVFYVVAKSSPGIQELDRLEELEAHNRRLYQNGLITYEEYLAARTSGRPALQSQPGDVTGAADPRRSAEPAGRKDREWIMRILRGNWYNKARLFDYPYHELYIVNPAGGYYRLDAYDPGKAIVSRKFTQLASVTVETAIGYIDELLTKYPVGAVIADVPSSGLQTGGAPTEGSLAGKRLVGTPTLEVPYQIEPVQKAVTEYAEAHGVEIRSDTGQLYTKAANNVCCCTETK